ncbi:MULTISPECIES: RidA family protein [unclassified Phenylobacterium]|jgi:enamine deaminase RidA (YjgF/YER057c/UK114 family)|uniref:RidA family protein n=1 Tax=unclassified Phenylobacterium TaxID=2640670 RepID=UPI002151CD81|nr:MULTISPECIES: RidA family protein [unclassified Phenylobacterium]MCR5873174.1 RidA family protein [Phenylobacterium sp. J426]MCR5880111.1 RidA family protein [Phenylobacterium sp. J367]
MTSASFDDRLNALGIALPPAGAPVANYVPVVLHDGLATVSGQLPRDGRGLVTGKVGEDLSAEAARAAARLCGLSVIAQLRAALGGRLDRVVRCVQLTGFVNAGPAFTDHPQVVNGASDLMVEVFGEAGRHARAAVGAGSLPLGAAVEVAAVFAVRP